MWEPPRLDRQTVLGLALLVGVLWYAVVGAVVGAGRRRTRGFP